MSARGPWFETQGRFFWILLHFLLMVTRHKHLDIHSHGPMVSGIERIYQGTSPLRMVMVSDESNDFCYLSLDTSSIFKSTSSFRQACANPLWPDGDPTARTVLRRRLLNP
ncbi:hypothetical protein M438DRAFT_56559 [Aureobasidium pullulans EXF-150]|uniref:Fungal-type protein kinase domain-containing protein n=1 Tax=Aureobasidium pullulans EXF-150 TaxID=1043002 RepID=A0A074Y5J1_AURPU|nr:uncharacterized protein M438DRAFT_56559 [Aureobasidium pullulans EXF-150]KEQ82146.1 hypothetical protein M438DRAFT_56559 [Aureobasidium pullulans EXF-150]